MRRVLVGSFTIICLLASPAWGLEALDDGSSDVDVDFRDQQAGQTSAAPGSAGVFVDGSAASKKDEYLHDEPAALLRTRPIFSFGLSQLQSYSTGGVDVSAEPSFYISTLYPAGRYLSFIAGYSKASSESSRDTRVYSSLSAWVDVEQEFSSDSRSMYAGAQINLTSNQKSTPYISWSRSQLKSDFKYKEAGVGYFAGVTTGFRYQYQQSLDPETVYATSYGLGFDHLISSDVEVGISANHVIINDERQRSVGVGVDFRLSQHGWFGLGYSDLHDAGTSSIGVRYSLSL